MIWKQWIIRKKKSVSKYDKTLDTTNLEYIIYVRKSSEESTGKQVQSIYDQIRICLKFAENNNIKVRKKDWLYDVFNKIEKEQFIKSRKKEKKIKKEDIELEEQIKDLFIIKESKSAKIPWLRLKWTELINLVKKWKIKWILSYSPDRQSRNLLEWWEIVNLVDDYMVDLKYTNFHFENTPSWKMMLWVWFVFSKQYSDKLWEDAWRWSLSAFYKWAWLWIYKHWYVYDKELRVHKKHPKNFDLIEEAFRMKIDDKKTDSEILEYLNESWYEREYTKWKVWNMTKSVLNAMWLDPFYYGVLLYWWQEKDLRETNQYYEPMITEEEYNELLYRSSFSVDNNVKTNYKVKEDIDAIMVVPNSMISVDNTENDNMNCVIKNKPRVLKRLDKIKKETWNNNLTILDVLKINDIYYTSKIVEIPYLKIEEKILELLKWMQVSDEDYKISLSIIQRDLQDMNEKKDDEKKLLNLQISKLEKRELELITINTGRIRDETEDIIYQKEKINIRNLIKEKKEELDDLDKKLRDLIFEFETTTSFLRDGYNTFINASYVQKRKIVEILFLHIKITPEKVIKFTFHEGMDEFFPIWQGR